MPSEPSVAIIGGGAAGFFAAINLAGQLPGARITIYEKSAELLSKVKISGGGRCNVTNACFDVAKLISYYPRGNKELRSAFSRFQPRDTVAWFNNHGVELKTEPDGRMFPVSNTSRTIIDCFIQSSERLGIQIRTQYAFSDFEAPTDSQGTYILHFTGKEIECADYLLITTGGSASVMQMLEAHGIPVNDPVPSLFSLHVEEVDFKGLSGISVQETEVSLLNTKYKSRGPLLITHNGFSGPAVLALSSHSARYLHDAGYRAGLRINWLPGENEESLFTTLRNFKQKFANKIASREYPFKLPARLAEILLEKSGITAGRYWREIPDANIRQLAGRLVHTQLTVVGKSPNKEEFVTCGGADLRSVDFRTMESRVYPGLYFAGEVLDIDGLTGGFNFQAAWTTAYIASHGITQRNKSS